MGIAARKLSLGFSTVSIILRQAYYDTETSCILKIEIFFVNNEQLRC